MRGGDNVQETLPESEDDEETLEHVFSNAVILMVVDEYEVHICTVESFPSEKDSLTWMCDIWVQAMESEGEDWILTERICHLIRSWGSHIHGHIIKTVCLLIQPHYGFSGTVNTSAIIKNRTLSFHYQNPKALKGFCQNAIISNILSSMWFTNCNADGIVYNNYFSPIPIVCLSLIFIVLSFGIEEWSMGSHKQVPFMEKAAEAHYKAHLLGLVAWNSLNKVVTEKICQRLCDYEVLG
ncbi:hypothetical protein BDQ17DRAFT_1338141 [Cyathus striatus]|nr:hypothetical protein BDQ17DRAFT_1338141 [Cyathus striatus]